MKTINKKRSLSIVLLTTFALFLSMQFNLFAQTSGPPNPFTPCTIVTAPEVTGLKVATSTPVSCTDCKITGSGTPVYDKDGNLTGHTYNVQTNPTITIDEISCTRTGAKATDKCKVAGLIGGQQGSCPSTVFITKGPGSGTGTGS